MGGKKRAKQFSRTIRMVRAKNVGKKLSEKSAKKRFLYSNEYRDQKMGEKTRETIFPENTNSASKKCLKKSSEKSAKIRFLNSHKYRDQKFGGKKRAKQFF